MIYFNKRVFQLRYIKLKTCFVCSSYVHLYITIDTVASEESFIGLGEEGRKGFEHFFSKQKFSLKGILIQQYERYCRHSFICFTGVRSTI